MKKYFFSFVICASLGWAYVSQASFAGKPRKLVLIQMPGKPAEGKKPAIAPKPFLFSDGSLVTPKDSYVKKTLKDLNWSDKCIDQFVGAENNSSRLKIFKTCQPVLLRTKLGIPLVWGNGVLAKKLSFVISMLRWEKNLLESDIKELEKIGGENRVSENQQRVDFLRNLGYSASKEEKQSIDIVPSSSSETSIVPFSSKKLTRHSASEASSLTSIVPASSHASVVEPAPKLLGTTEMPAILALSNAPKDQSQKDVTIPLNESHSEKEQLVIQEKQTKKLYKLEEEIYYKLGTIRSAIEAKAEWERKGKTQKAEDVQVRIEKHTKDLKGMVEEYNKIASPLKKPQLTLADLLGSSKE